MGDAPATTKAFAAASHRVRVWLINNRVTAASMETRGAIGHHNPFDQSYVLYSSTQNPHRVRETAGAMCLSHPQVKLRVVGFDVGGGFGMKGDTYPEEALVFLASQLVDGRSNGSRAGRCVQSWTRSAGDQTSRPKWRSISEGHISGHSGQALHNLGAYMVGAGMVPPVFSLKLIPNVYRVPVMDLSTQGVFTNTAPTDPYRGAGRPGGRLCTERLLIWQQPSWGSTRSRSGGGILSTRRHSVSSPTGLTYDSGDFRAAADACVGIWPTGRATRPVAI